MIINDCFKTPGLILAAAFFAGTSLGTKAFAQEYPYLSYLIDLNNGTVTDLGSLYGKNIRARAINDAGQVIGGYTAADGLSHVFIAGPNGDSMKDLSTLGVNYVTDINDAGQVVGSFDTAEGTRHAFITGPDGMGMRDLGTLGGESSVANGINDEGQVVGSSVTAEGNRHAFITGPNGMGMRDLGTLGGDRSIARGINDMRPGDFPEFIRPGYTDEAHKFLQAFS